MTLLPERDSDGSIGTVELPRTLARAYDSYVN